MIKDFNGYLDVAGFIKYLELYIDNKYEIGDYVQLAIQYSVEESLKK